MFRDKDWLTWSIRLLILIGIFAWAPSQINHQDKKHCRWNSEQVRDAAIQIKSTSARGIVSGELIWKDKVIRQMEFGQPSGYGSRWWAFTAPDGEAYTIWGRLIAFKGNQPLKGTKSINMNHSKPRRVLLIDLSKSLSYSELPSRKDLLIAGEGFWNIPEGCKFPGRHI